MSSFRGEGGVHIRFFGNGCLGFRPDGGSLLKSAKVSKTLLPHHSVPRLGSACLNEGIAPWAAAKGHPWPSAANPASMPGCPLRNTFVQPSWFTGRPRSTSTARRPDSRPGSGGTVFPLWNECGSELARDGGGSVAWMLNLPASSRASSLPQEKRDPTQNQVGYQAASLLFLISGAPLTTLAERRHCAVGIPAWMPG